MFIAINNDNQEEILELIKGKGIQCLSLTLFLPGIKQQNVHFPPCTSNNNSISADFSVQPVKAAPTR